MKSSPTRRALLVLAALAPAAARAESGAMQPVQELNDGLLAVMRAGRSASFAERTRMLAPVVQNAFDLERILRSSVGPRFAGFPPAEQQSLLDVFTDFTVASYVANFDDYKGEHFEISPHVRKAGPDQVVQTQMVQPGADPLKLDYVVHNEGGTYRIVDVLLNGSISRVAVQRSDFRSLLGSGGAAPLIDSLRSKVAQLSAGSAG